MHQPRRIVDYSLGREIYRLSSVYRRPKDSFLRGSDIQGSMFHSVRNYRRQQVQKLTHSGTSVTFLVTPSVVRQYEPRCTCRTVQDSSEVLHISQIVRADFAIEAKGIQYFPTKACVDFRVFGKHGHRERCQTSSLGFEFSSALRWHTSKRTVSRPANRILNVSSLIIS